VGEKLQTADVTPGGGGGKTADCRCDPWGRWGENCRLQM
jgi:hypothetical protein